MRDYNKLGRELLILWIYFILEFQGTHPLSCHACLENKDITDRCRTRVGEVLACPVSAKVCVISSGFRVGTAKSYPVMTRRCSLPMEAAQDTMALAAATANGYKMVCVLIARKPNSGLPPDFLDRRCICTEDKCNSKFWDEVVVQPYFQANFSEGDKPVIPTSPGKESLENVNKVLGLTPGETPDYVNPTTEDASNTDDTSGQSKGLSDVATSGTTATDSYGVTTAVSSTADEGSGSKTGLIAGLAVGGLILLGLLSGSLYWFFVIRKQKKKRKSSDGSDASDNSTDTDASGDDND